MKTLRIITAVCFFSILATAHGIAAKAHSAENVKRPNIVYFYADDWRWDCLGLIQKEQGDKARFPWLETPRMDKVAREGILFRNSFVVNSLCSPGRACVMTSQYSHLNGVIGNSQPLSPAIPTVGPQLQKAGYTTAYCGKFHMGTQRRRPGF